MNNFQQITGFPQGGGNMDADETKIYGLAIFTDSLPDWVTYSGSVLYIMGIYQGTTSFSEIAIKNLAC